MGFEPSEEQKLFAQRLKKRRDELGFTRRDVAEKINHINSNPNQKEITLFTVANWERGHIPRPATQRLLAYALELDPAYLMGISKENDSQKPTEESDSQKPIEENVMHEISIADLQNHGGEAVWIRPYDCRIPEYSALVSYSFDYLITADEKRIPFTNIQGTVWTLPILADKRILSLEEAQEAKEVYMEPIRASTDIRMRLRGWYSYDDNVRSFYKADGGFLFKACDYGKMFIGYRFDPNGLMAKDLYH